MTQRCPICGVKYPPELLTPINSTRGSSAPLCGICGLAFVNQAYGLRRKKFRGEAAESLRQAAIRWRKKLGVKP